MKNRLIGLFCAFSLLGFISGSLVSLQAGCKTLSPEAKQNILSVEKVACGLANAFLSDPQITALCNFADQETAPILNLISMHRVALAQSKAVGMTEGASRPGRAGIDKPCSAETSSVSLDGGAPDAANLPPASAALKDAGVTKEGGPAPLKK